MTERAHDRIPFCVRVQFRNASSFLVAYTVNLWRGGAIVDKAAANTKDEAIIPIRIPERSMINGLATKVSPQNFISNLIILNFSNSTLPSSIAFPEDLASFTAALNF